MQYYNLCISPVCTCIFNKYLQYVGTDVVHVILQCMHLLAHETLRHTFRLTL